MRGDLYTGYVKLAGDFPPSLNTTDDVTALKIFESPACYGVDCQRDGQLKTGSIPTGTDRSATTKTVGASTFYWYYDRLWIASGATLIYGARYYDDVYVPVGRGKVTAYATIVDYQPCLKNQMWVSTASGSQFIPNADSDAGQLSLTRFIQELFVSTGKSTSALVLDEVPYVANTKGIFSYDGNGVKEWTRPVRYTLGVFDDEPAIKADYQSKFIIGSSKFVLDPLTGKLFDYGTSGFLYTSRTLTGTDYRPFSYGDIFFSIEFGSVANGTITWQTKVEDEDWHNEEDISVVVEDGKKTVISTRSNQQMTTVHKFALRITSLSSNIYIRDIGINVAEFSRDSYSG